MKKVFFVLLISCTFGINSSLTFPGTKWCGPGNISKNYEDLGILRELDICCRQHDGCPNYILPGTKSYGYYNEWLHTTISECSCDEEFKKCLKTANQFGFKWLINRMTEMIYSFWVTKCLSLKDGLKKN